MCIGISLCRGESMIPTLKKKSLVGYMKHSNYKPDDIVMFKGSDGKIYCHRIVATDGKTITTKGDNMNKSEDYEIDRSISDVIGKVIFHFP